MTKLVTFGETMVQHNATYRGFYMEEGEYELDPAGAESNVAVDLRKLLPNVQTVWVSRLGNDEFGTFIVDELSNKTVVAAVQHDGEWTGVSYLNHLPDGRHVKTYRRKGSASSRLTFGDIEPQLVAVDILHVTGITPALSETCHETMFSCLDYGEKHKIPISFDLNYREQLWKTMEPKSVIDKMLRYSSVFKTGYDEAELIWEKGYEAVEYAKYFQSVNGRLVVVTKGAGGALAFDGTNLVEQPGYDIEVVDPIGAGDAFTAGFLAGILKHSELKEFYTLDVPTRKKILLDALRIGNVCGALTCTRRGDTAAMPTMQEVEQFRKRYGR